MTPTPNPADPMSMFSLVERFGFPVVLVGVLLYILLGDVRKNMITTSEAAAQAVQAANKSTSMIQSHIEATGSMNAEMLWYLRVMCLHQASTETERNQCVPPKSLVQGLLLESQVRQ